MVVWLLIFIVVILLFGAAAVKGVLARAMLFVLVLIGGILLLAIVSETTLMDWLKFGGAVMLVSATAFVGNSVLARRSEAASKRQSLQDTWDFYEKRGLFTEPNVREQAIALRGHGDSWALDEYCHSQLSGDSFAPGDAVQRVWNWFADDIESRFDPKARARARALMDAKDALRLDRFCRETLESLPSSDR